MHAYKKKLKSKIPNTILILVALLFLVPLIWLILAAFNTQATQALGISSEMSVENFRAVLSESRNINGFINSFIISMIQTILVLIFAVMAAYPLSRYRLKTGQRISMGLLFLTSIPITALMVPVYQLFISLKLVDSLAGVIVFFSAATLPYGIWMTKNFLDAIPFDLEESAKIDGANHYQCVTRIILPLMRPGLFTVAMFTFIRSWGDFFVPYILLSATKNVTASVNIYRFFGEKGNVVYGQLAAYSILYMIPVFVLYFLSQNYMSQGFAMAGASKE